ncbi:MAG: AraC family transcriptional regulator [Mucilaginibacter sp.]
MKPELLKISNQSTHSFSIRQDMVPNINSRWHYHPEIELIYFHKGSGMQFVGDSIKRFERDSIALIGANLPHYWKFDEEPEYSDEHSYSTVIHFFEDFWSSTFLNLPENKIIKHALEKAGRGIEISAKNEPQIGQLINQMAASEGPARIIYLMEVLALIGSISNPKLLSSIGFTFNFEEADKHRINLIYDYSFAHFKDKILLENIAEIASLTPNSFCRYFKAKTSKTYLQFVSEIRVGHACKLLIEDEISIKQICYESGFNNFSSFHSTFKAITGKTPLGYKQNFMPKAVF